MGGDGLPPLLSAQRLHALDNLRALMMWLGIVIHVSVNHMTGPMLVPWRDQATTEFADLLGALIHVFRMPVFLMMAGFFVAMLVERRGAQEMLRHRMRRVALPFAVFWPVIFLLTAVLAMIYAHRTERGTFGLSAEVIPMLPHAPMLNTMHLWFIYQLIGFSLLTFVLLKLAPRLPAALRQAVSLSFLRLGERPWGFVVLAIPLGLIGAQYPNGLLVVNGSFLPPISEWIHHGLFYAFGYCLYGFRDVLLPRYMAQANRLALAGLVFALLSAGMLKQLHLEPETVGPGLRLITAWGYNAATWLWSFALIGLALRYLNRPSATMRYLADSSYWVYLVHMLGTIGFGALLYGAPLPAGAKMLINIAATTLFALLTYQLFVRHSFIGRFLNGKGPPVQPPVAQRA